MPKISSKREKTSLPVMNSEQVIQEILGERFQLPQSSAQKTCLDYVGSWTNQTLNDLEELERLRTVKLVKDRIGPPIACFDIKTHAGLFVINKERLCIYSQSNFCTVKCNSCVFKGKWQYEVTLLSEGVMQIGWATSNCKFTQEIGVGDTLNSYAYDGQRVRKWNISTYKYGESWLSGDTIGSTIDLDKQTIEFFRNGRSLGMAFDNLQIGPGIAYFPAVSLSYTEQLEANFGASPMRFPVSGFEPIQDPPCLKLVQAEQLSTWLLLLLTQFEHNGLLLNAEYQLSTLKDVRDVATSSKELSANNNTFLMSLADVFLTPLAPLLTIHYITEACLLPMIENLCKESSFIKGKVARATKPKLMLLLDILTSFMEENEIQACFGRLIACIIARFQQVAETDAFSTQKRYLLLFTNIIQHVSARQCLLEFVLFDRSKLAYFTYLKPLSNSTLATLVKNPWWNSEKKDPKFESKKLAYLAECRHLEEAVAMVEALQIDMVKTLLDNTDGSHYQPSSRKIFLRKFRNFLYENAKSNKALSIFQIPQIMILSCFHCIFMVLIAIWETEVKENPIRLSPRIFYDLSINYRYTDRLGGLFSYLVKDLRDDLIPVLGEDHETLAPTSRVTDMDQLHLPDDELDMFPGPDNLIPAQLLDEATGAIIPIMARIVHQHQTLPFLTHNISTHTEPGEIAAKPSLIELCDGLILFYHRCVHKQYSKVNEIHINMGKYTTALTEVTSRLEYYRKESRGQSSGKSNSNRIIVEELEQTCLILEQELEEQSRTLAWYRATDLTGDKQRNLVSLLKIVLDVVKKSSNEGNLFKFLPAYYLETLLEIGVAVRTYLPPTSPTESIDGFEDLLTELAEFLCDHFSDPRIVLDMSRDSLIHGLASFVCLPNTLAALERVSFQSRNNLVCALLRPYENRAWAQSNSVLVRIWQGCGFAFRYQKSPHLRQNFGPKFLHVDSGLIFQAIEPCPSRLFQEHVHRVMIGNEDLSISFINSLLNQLNWSFSEFIGMLQEIQNVTSRPEQIIIDSHQLKICATCFDLALALLRVLEMIVSIAPQIFCDSSRRSADLLLSRLFQLLCQVLNRVSSQNGCFQHVILLQKAELDCVNHFPILAAVVGILVALLADDLESFDVEQFKDIPKLSSALLHEPSFQIDSLHFVLGNLQNSTMSKKRIEVFSLENYAEDVNPEEINLVTKMISMLEFYSSRLSHATVVSDDDLCTICYAFPLSAIFKPCEHQSCRSCIDHHLMNSRHCFFCKGVIQSVEGKDGSILHDLTVMSDAQEAT